MEMNALLGFRSEGTVVTVSSRSPTNNLPALISRCLDPDHRNLAAPARKTVGKSLLRSGNVAHVGLQDPPVNPAPDFSILL